MELNEFINHFISGFDGVITVPITGETNFREEIDEWDSLTAMTIIAIIIDEYGVSLKGEELKKCTTVNDIFELVRSKK